MLFSNNKFWYGFIIFIALNIFLYVFIFKFNKIPFDSFDYTYNSHHYLRDNRIDKGPFNFLRSLGQYDAQWYLKIANDSYPTLPKNIDMNNKKVMDGLTFAFFPFYPLAIRTINYAFKNVELSAFVLSNLLLLLDFISLFFVVSKLYKIDIALKTIFLLFLFPFSIFFRSYFTESLLLLELVWFSHFLINRKWIFSSIILGLMIVTRGAGIFILPVFFYFLYKNTKTRNLNLQSFFWIILFSLTPLFLWLSYCYLQTGNALYFLSIRSVWFSDPVPILHNFLMIFLFWKLPLHNFHTSQIDVTTIIVLLALLIKSKKMIKPELWLISFALWLGPLLTTDTMSFTRYQIISFPIFIYLAQILVGYKYWALTIIFFLGLLFTSLLFVNWYWLG